jgi:hypothetical protein
VGLLTRTKSRNSSLQHGLKVWLGAWATLMQNDAHIYHKLCIQRSIHNAWM